MSMDRNLRRALDLGEPGPERRDGELSVDADPEEREALEEALTARDEEEVELQRRHSETDDPQP